VNQAILNGAGRLPPVEPCEVRYVAFQRQHRCPACGLWFRPVKVTKNYCDATCRARASRARKRKAA
jgi:hypothetical protein